MQQDLLLQKLDELTKKVDSLLETLKSIARNSSEWLDKQETMEILKCSERTLQTLRDNDFPYSNPLGGRKYFYR
jgi:hypothetical protein